METVGCPCAMDPAPGHTIVRYVTACQLYSAGIRAVIDLHVYNVADRINLDEIHGRWISHRYLSELLNLLFSRWHPSSRTTSSGSQVAFMIIHRP